MARFAPNRISRGQRGGGQFTFGARAEDAELRHLPELPVTHRLEELKPYLDRAKTVAGHYIKRAARFAARHPVAVGAMFSALTLGIGAPAALLLYGTGKFFSVTTRPPRRALQRRMQEAIRRFKQNNKELKELLERAQTVSPEKHLAMTTFS